MKLTAKLTISYDELGADRDTLLELIGQELGRKLQTQVTTKTLGDDSDYIVWATAETS